MPFVKGNTIGKETRFKTGQSGNPAGRPPDRLRKRIEAELEKIASSEPGQARTKLEMLAENIVDDALRGDSQSRKLLIERLYPMLNRHEIAGAEGEAINIRWEAEMQQAAAELQRILQVGSIGRPREADASVK